MKKKVVTALLTLLATATMTACNMRFMVSDFSVQVPEITQEIEVDVAKELTNIIDNADFKSNVDLGKLAEDITNWAEEYASKSEYLDEFQKATLVRVVDGDTIVVNVENGEYTVRLIGINTPESVASEEYLEKTGKENTEEGMLASEFVKSLLSNVDTVYLQKDTSDTDPYDRLLRYVWLEIPTDANNIDEISEKMLNGILVLEGVAEPVYYAPDGMYKEEFEYLDELNELNY